MVTTEVQMLTTRVERLEGANRQLKLVGTLMALASREGKVFGRHRHKQTEAGGAPQQSGV